MTDSDRQRDILLAALDTAQNHQRAAQAQARTAVRRATDAETRAHHLEQQLEQAHQLVAEQTRLIDTLGARPAKETVA